MRKNNDSSARESKLASGWTVESAPAAPEADEVAEDVTVDSNGVLDVEADAQSQQMSNATLVILGVFGGIYLMYTWVWFSWAKYHAGINDLVAAGSGSLGGILQQIVLWVGPLAPIGWFFCALILNKGAPTWRLAMWIVLGAVVLVPLPMIMWGA